VTIPVTVLSPPLLYNGSQDNDKPVTGEATMKSLRQRPRRAATLAVMAAVAVLTTACGVHVHFGASASPASTPSNSFAQELALAQCMRGHGEPDFPDPAPSGGFNASVLSTFDNSQGEAAYGDCRHLLAGGGPSLAQLEQDLQQAQQKEEKALPALLKFAQCMRGHGVPDFPDPTLSGQGVSGNFNGADIKANSSQFQAAVSACQHLVPGGTLHASTQGSAHGSPHGS
jgi:hypothetical protein